MNTCSRSSYMDKGPSSQGICPKALARWTAENKSAVGPTCQKYWLKIITKGSIKPFKAYIEWLLVIFLPQTVGSQPLAAQLGLILLICELADTEQLQGNRFSVFTQEQNKHSERAGIETGYSDSISNRYNHDTMAPLQIFQQCWALDCIDCINLY